MQITGDKVTGDVYIAGMDEDGWRPHNRANKIFRSTDGGNTWTNTYTGRHLPWPGRSACSVNPYFTCMFPENGGLLAAHGLGSTCRLQRRS